MEKSIELMALTESINRLQVKRSYELALLKDQFHLTYESLKPLNLIKHTFKEVSSSTEIKEGMLNNVIGLTTGYFTKAILIGSSANPVKKILGTLLQFAVAAFVARNSDSIKSIGSVVLNKIFKTQNDKNQKFPENGNGITVTTLKD
jgi:hypothetical protein